ncbi:hypothetical protein [Staphylococcus ratti]|uniref:Staphylococcal protein n=1 Tax=Staphylococcus ratti TaxID=2892440 RepID=A0ABY3PF40_9STAP|nr:hypothetical protein [Staphylococcus ratti]UEX90906.1 hypothetical protein LN051_04635 [Staphylococcus ratti]
MRKYSIKSSIEKQLWFLSKREKVLLQQQLSALEDATFKAHYVSKNHFVITFLKQHVFNQRPKSQLHLVTTLVGLMVMNVLLLGAFITGLLLSLTSMKHLLSSSSTLDTSYVVMILVASLFVGLGALLLMKPTNAWLTKRLLDYKLNRVAHK